MEFSLTDGIWIHKVESGPVDQPGGHVTTITQSMTRIDCQLFVRTVFLAPTTWSRCVHFSGISGPFLRFERVWGSKWPFVMPLFVPVVHMQWSQIGGWTARPKTNYILVKVEISDSDKANQGGRSIGSYNAIICYSQWTTFSCSFYEVGLCEGQPRSHWTNS